MGSVERSKKKAHLWKKAILHFSVCFVMGFFTGFAPTGKSSIFSTKHIILDSSSNFSQSLGNANTSSINQIRTEQFSNAHQEHELLPKKLLIIVTPTSVRNRFQGVFLRRLANTMRLVGAPLLWIVVEGQRSDNSENVSEILRKSGVMYRHLVMKENLTDSTEGELDHQRNVALRHIEHHRLNGIVHFAGLSNVYDLDFFNELREIEVFGTWPVAVLGAHRNKVIIEGPVCDSSEVIGWHLKKMNNNNSNESKDSNSPPSNSPPPIHISSFGFNSSILWDPERWGRPSSSLHQDTSQPQLTLPHTSLSHDTTPAALSLAAHTQVSESQARRSHSSQARLTLRSATATASTPPAVVPLLPLQPSLTVSLNHRLYSAPATDHQHNKSNTHDHQHAKPPLPQLEQPLA
ncbi:hypothetical protein ACFE04_020494 [Oxalis oulophora]